MCSIRVRPRTEPSQHLQPSPLKDHPASASTTNWLALDKSCIAHLSPDERRQAQHWLSVHAGTPNLEITGTAHLYRAVSAGSKD